MKYSAKRITGLNLFSEDLKKVNKGQSFYLAKDYPLRKRNNESRTTVRTLFRIAPFFVFELETPTLFVMLKKKYNHDAIIHLAASSTIAPQLERGKVNDNERVMIFVIGWSDDGCYVNDSEEAKEFAGNHIQGYLESC